MNNLLFQYSYIFDDKVDFLSPKMEGLSTEEETENIEPKDNEMVRIIIVIVLDINYNCIRTKLYVILPTFDIYLFFRVWLTRRITVP